MTITQNFDFIDYKVKVEYIDGFITVDTGYISRMCYLIEDPSVIIPSGEEDTQSRIQVAYGYDFKFIMDLTAEEVSIYPEYPELADYFYKSNVKTIDVLVVGSVADMSKFLVSEYIKELNGRCYTVVVDSEIDDSTIDPNFITKFNGAFLVTRAVVDELPPNKFGCLFIEEINPIIRNTELMHFAGWFFNRTDFLGQISMTQLDYETTYWLDMQGLTDASDGHYIGFGNQNGNTYVSSFFIGDQNSMKFYRKEQIKRAIQQAVFNLLTVDDKYNQTTINRVEILTKKVINSYPWITKDATFVYHTVFAQMPSEYRNKYIIPIKASIVFEGETDRVIIELYDISNVYGVGA